MDKGKTQCQLAGQKIKHRQRDEGENARETSIAHELRLPEAIVGPLSRPVNKQAGTENITNVLFFSRPNKTRVTDNREFTVISKVLQERGRWFNRPVLRQRKIESGSSVGQLRVSGVNRRR